MKVSSHFFLVVEKRRIIEKKQVIGGPFLHSRSRRGGAGAVSHIPVRKTHFSFKVSAQMLIACFAGLKYVYALERISH